MQILIILTFFLTIQVHSQSEITSKLKENQLKGCIWLYKTYISENKASFDEAKSQYQQDGDKFQARTLVQAVEACQSWYTQASDMEIFIQRYKQNKDIYFLEMIGHVEKYTVDIEQKISPKGLAVIKMAKTILEAKEESESVIVLGYDLNKLPKEAKVYYLITYTLFVGLALWYGLRDIKPSIQKIQ